MLTTCTVVLMMCGVMCVQSDVLSGNTDKKTMGETPKDTNAVLDQVVEELRYLRDEDMKNKNEINNLKDEDKKNKDDINNLKELNEKFLNEINNLKGTNSQQTGVASAAFMAVMIEGFFYPSTGEIIPFERVLLNVGQHYDDRNSVFTCAESGLYLFSVTLYSGSIKGGSGSYNRMSAALMLDGVNVAQIHSETGDYDYSQEHQAAVTAVVECPAGSTVWVECRQNYSKMFGSYTEPRSVFTGFAITYNMHP